MDLFSQCASEKTVKVLLTGNDVTYMMRLGSGEWQPSDKRVLRWSLCSVRDCEPRYFARS